MLTSAGYLLLKAGHYMGQVFDATLATLHLTGREFLVLSFVSAAEGLSQQELAEHLGLDPTIIVGLVDSLEDRGLMTRTHAIVPTGGATCSVSPMPGTISIRAPSRPRRAQRPSSSPR